MDFSNHPIIFYAYNSFVIQLLYSDRIRKVHRSLLNVGSLWNRAITCTEISDPATFVRHLVRMAFYLLHFCYKILSRTFH